MRYVIARLQTERRDEAYRFYVTEGIKAISKAVSNGLGAGSYLKSSLADILGEGEEPDSRSLEEIVDHVWASIERE